MRIIEMINKKSPFANCNTVFNVIFIILGAFSWFAPDIFNDLRYKYTLYFIVTGFVVIYVLIFLFFNVIAHFYKTKKYTGKTIIYLVLILCCFLSFFIFFNIYSSVSFESYNNITRVTFLSDDDISNPKKFEQRRDEIKEVFRSKYQIRSLIKSGNYKISIEFDGREPFEIRRKISGFKCNINVKHLGR